MLDAYFSRLIPLTGTLGGDVHVEELPPMRIKGKAEPVTAYVLHHLPG